MRRAGILLPFEPCDREASLTLRFFSLLSILFFCSTLASAPGVQNPAPADSAAPLTSRVFFHDYDVELPYAQGWRLVRMAPEDEAITIALYEGEEPHEVRRAELSVARVGFFERRAPRDASAVFAAIALAETTRAKAEDVTAGTRWLGAHVDSTSAGSRLYYRLWYGTTSQGLSGHAWIACWFPPSFAQDGFYLRGTLQYWERRGENDQSVLGEFIDALRTLHIRPVELDVRVVPERSDSLGERLSLPFVYYDARARALNSPHDTTRAPCWTQLEDSVAVGLQATRVPGTTFVSFRQRAPAAGDRNPGERFGKAFDRNGDGRFDLLFLSQGWAKGQDLRDMRTFFVVADDDGDGRVDGAIYEDGDNDRDGLVDHALFVQDRARRGEPDHAWVVGPDIAHPVRPAPHRGTVFYLTRASRRAEEQVDLGLEFRDWSRYLEWLNRAKKKCGE